MRLEPVYNTLVHTNNQKMIDALQYLEYDLEQSEMNLAAYITLIDQLDQFKALLQRAVPDWKISTREQFREMYEEDEVKIFEDYGVV